jgi:Tfp pilus assembly protein PilN
MKYPINLATQPFRRDRPVLIGSSLVAILLVGMLGVLISISVMESGQLKDTRTDIARLQKRVRALSAEQARLDAILRQPENAEVLERSLFLNELLSRKGISWTRIFADLEKVTPYNVRVISIRPSANAQNQISLDMMVAAESPEPVIQFLKALEDSALFGGVYWHSMVPPSQTEPLFRYRVSVNYAQKL